MASSLRQMIVDRYKQGERDFSGIDLYQVDLSRLKLPGIVLKKANLTGCNLNSSDLQGADLEGANVSQANLEGANLFNANLNGVNFRRSNLRDAKLSSNALNSAILTGCTLPNGNIFTTVTPIEEQLAMAEVAAVVVPTPIKRQSLRYEPKYEPKVRSWDEFRQDLPKIPLAALGVGFALFGLHLGLLRAHPLTYVVMLLILWVSCLRINFAPLLPILGLLLVMLSGPIPIYMLIFGVLILFVILIYSLMYFNGMEESIGSIAFVGGLPIVLLFIWGIVVGTVQGFSLAIVLPAFFTMGLGSLVPIDLGIQQYSRSQIIKLTMAVGTIGVVLGGAIGMAVGMQN